MKRAIKGLVSMGLLCVLAFPGAIRATGETKLELDNLLENDRESVIKTDMEEAGVGDNKVFEIKTDKDMTSLETGDIYRNDEKTFFKVSGFKSKDSSGGVFFFQRISGQADPGKKFHKISGQGPQTIVSRTTLLDLYIMGGPFLHPIAVLFVAMIVLAINSILLYRREKQCPTQFLAQAEQALEAGDIETFKKLANSTPGFFPAVCRAMVDRFETSSLDDIKFRCDVAANRQIGKLRIPIKALNLIAVAAPLLGLLGTIVGMVIVFEAVAGATGAAKASALASGIRVKLFSTASALMVAIPALFLFFIFNQKLNALVSDCEVLAERFIHRLALIKRAGAGTDSGNT
ncbi:MAG: MotA/TolQ/ExbB proton channel family protein [bacterium]